MRRDSVSPATPELKKGSLELLVLSVLAHSPRHGYEIGRLIELGSGDHLTFRITTLYPVLYRLENRGLIAGRWVERAGERRRRYYRLTEAGKAALVEQRGRLCSRACRPGRRGRRGGRRAGAARLAGGSDRHASLRVASASAA
ncbi:MAG: PadR family transcriptional regulator [Bacteroidales bacterium]